jgi:hypothetical protein
LGIDGVTSYFNSTIRFDGKNTFSCKFREAGVWKIIDETSNCFFYVDISTTHLNVCIGESKPYSTGSIISDPSKVNISNGLITFLSSGQISVAYAGGVTVYYIEASPLVNAGQQLTFCKSLSSNTSYYLSGATIGGSATTGIIQT